MRHKRWRRGLLAAAAFVLISAPAAGPALAKKKPPPPPPPPGSLACSNFQAANFNRTTSGQTDPGSVSLTALTQALANQAQPSECTSISYTLVFETWGQSSAGGTPPPPPPTKASQAAILPPGSGQSLGTVTVTWGANGEPLVYTCPAGASYCTSGTGYDAIAASGTPANPPGAPATPALGVNQDFCAYVFSSAGGSVLHYDPGTGTPDYVNNNPPIQRECWDASGGSGGGGGFS